MQIDHTTPLCFVDLETTGTSARHDRVIEVGIVRVEHGKVVRTYRTFLDPGRPVPAFITSLTGISTTMLLDAPPFEEVALEIAAVIEGAVFVAHNAMFDYLFLTEEYRRLGISFSHPYLCTAKLSRKLFPKVQGHSVDALVARFDLDAGARHRALDDALVLKQFLEAIMARLGNEAVYTAMYEMLRVRRLPQHVKEEMITRLPEAPGVYFFYGSEHELLYVGKSRRVRTRVRSHFAKDGLSGRGRDMLSEIRSIEYQETVGELGALLLESHLIKERTPVYNIREREVHALYVLREHRTASGHSSVTLGCVDTVERGSEYEVIGLFRTKRQAQERLTQLAKDHALCPYLLGIEHTAPCFAYQLEQCRGACVGAEKPRHYNKRFEEAFARERLRAWPYTGPVVLEERSASGAGELFIVDNWRLLSALHTEDGEWSELVPARFTFDYDVYKILARELLKRGSKVAVRELTSAEKESYLLPQTI